MIEINFLGTNGWFATNFGNTNCILIEIDKCYIILDAGDGIYKLNSYINKNKPIHLFLSHLHLDHIGGLHILNKFRFNQKLDIFGYVGIKEGLNAIIRHPYTASFNELPYKIEIHELSEGKSEFPFNFTCNLLKHTDPCLGYRFSLEDKIITYCTDTGICNNLYELAKDADLFISECSYQSGQIDLSWPHLNPEQAANIAKKSKAKKLILTHFDANIYKNLRSRKNSERKAKKIFKSSMVAYDGLNFTI